MLFKRHFVVGLRRFHAHFLIVMYYNNFACSFLSEIQYFTYNIHGDIWLIADINPAFLQDSNPDTST